MADKVVVRKWVDALRSGDYEQGRGFLGYTEGSRDHFCCLGVLCELAVAENVIGKETDGAGVHSYGTNDFRDGKMPPQEVCAWLGMVNGYDWSVEREDTGDDSVSAELADLNDTLGLTFDEIADLIEENFLR